MVNVIIQAIGFAAMAFLLISFQMPTKKKILFVQIIAITLYVIHYFLIGLLYTGSQTGFIMNIIALFRVIVFYFEDKPWFKRYTLSTIFIVIAVYIGIRTWSNVFSLFPILAAVNSTISLNVKKEKWFRVVIFQTSPLWLIYGVYSKSYSGIIGEVLNMISLIIAIIRYDVLHKDKNHVKVAEEDNVKLA